jgi:hypothetical protein
MEDSFWTDEEKDGPCSLSMSMGSWSTPVVGPALVRPAVQVRDCSRWILSPGRISHTPSGIRDYLCIPTLLRRGLSVKKENSARGDVVDKSGLNKLFEYKFWKCLDC